MASEMQLFQFCLLGCSWTWTLHQCVSHIEFLGAHRRRTNICVVWLLCRIPSAILVIPFSWPFPVGPPILSINTFQFGTINMSGLQPSTCAICSHQCVQFVTTVTQNPNQLCFGTLGKPGHFGMQEPSRSSCLKPLAALRRGPES